MDAVVLVWKCKIRMSLCSSVVNGHFGCNSFRFVPQNILSVFICKTLKCSDAYLLTKNSLPNISSLTYLLIKISLFNLMRGGISKNISNNKFGFCINFFLCCSSLRYN